VPRLARKVQYSKSMNTRAAKSQNLSPLIDRIERIRDELLGIQRALEAIELRGNEQEGQQREKVTPVG